jgi:hypothetical protein
VPPACRIGVQRAGSLVLVLSAEPQPLVQSPGQGGPGTPYLPNNKVPAPSTSPKAVLTGPADGLATRSVPGKYSILACYLFIRTSTIDDEGPAPRTALRCKSCLVHWSYLLPRLVSVLTPRLQVWSGAYVFVARASSGANSDHTGGASGIPPTWKSSMST